MIEIAASLQLAGAAYNAIKGALEKGQEAQDMYHAFAKFFDAKDQLSEANVVASNPSMVGKLFSGSSVEAQALEVTAARHKIRQIEKELREFLLYTGQAEFYEEMMKERRIIRQQRLEAAQLAAQKKANLIDMFAVAGFIAFIVGIISFFIAII